MKKFLTNLKHNYIYLIFAILPLILFLIPVFSRTFVDEIEEITYFYNIYNILDFAYQPILSSIIVVLIVGCGLNFITFFIYMWDGYKLPLIKREFNIFMLILNCFLALCCLGILGYSIYFSFAKGGDAGVTFYSTFRSGSVILSVTELILDMLLIRKNYRKEIDE